jgi:hypothetical protein
MIFFPQAPIMKRWRKAIVCEESAAIMQDSFWWCFLKWFQVRFTEVSSTVFCSFGLSARFCFFLSFPNQANAEVQDKIFSRVADNYVSLFVHLPVERRDEYFLVSCFL